MTFLNVFLRHTDALKVLVSNGMLGCVQDAVQVVTPDPTTLWISDDSDSTGPQCQKFIIKSKYLQFTGLIASIVIRGSFLRCHVKLALLLATVTQLLIPNTILYLLTTSFQLEFLPVREHAQLKYLSQNSFKSMIILH